MGYRLGVDMGTTYTAAAVYRDGNCEMLGLGNRAMQIPSVLYLAADGTFLVGEAAEARSAAEPERVVREFKRRIGDPVPILVAGSPFSAEALTARLLEHVVHVATERQGAPPDSIVVSHPANWGSYKLELLRHAFRLADLADVATCTEPEAAAIAYATRQRVDPGACIAVYDLGGGTFDAAVLRNDAAGFTLLGTPEGIEHLGGVDFDEAVFRHVLRVVGADTRELDPDDPNVIFALDRLRRDCVTAKETLSSDVEAVVAVALGATHTTVRLTRGDLEDMLRSPLEDTVRSMRRVLRSAEVEPDVVAAIVLVGGSSRIPLVSELLQGALRRPLAMDTHPKHDIALGAALHGARGTATVPPQPPVLPPPPAQPGPTETPVPPPGRSSPDRATRSRRGLLVAGAGAVLALAAVGIFVWPGLGSTSAGGKGGAGPTNNTTSAGQTSPPPTSPPPTSTSSTGGGPSTAAFNRPLGTRLPDNVIVWQRGDPGRLWSMTSDGAHRHQLVKNVPDTVTYGPPSISRDRRTIAYARDDGTGSQIHLMTTDGTRDRPLFDTVPARCPTASRPAFRPGDKELIVPCHSADPNSTDVTIYLVRLDGTFIGTQRAAGQIDNPTVNREGTKIVFWRMEHNGNTVLAEVNVVGRPHERTITDGPHDNDPVFSPVDDSLAFRGGPDLANQHIWVLPEGQKAPVQLTTAAPSPGYDQQDPTWSPDGKRIAYKDGPSNNANIAVVDVATGNTTTLMNDDVRDSTPAWSSR